MSDSNTPQSGGLWARLISVNKPKADPNEEKESNGSAEHASKEHAGKEGAETAEQPAEDVLLSDDQSRDDGANGSPNPFDEVEASEEESRIENAAAAAADFGIETAEEESASEGSSEADSGAATARAESEAENQTSSEQAGIEQAEPANSDGPPLAKPVTSPVFGVPLARPVELPPVEPVDDDISDEESVIGQESPAESKAPATEEQPASETPEEALEGTPDAAPPDVMPEVEAPREIICPACQAHLKPGSKYCDDCGFMIPADAAGLATAASVSNSSSVATRKPMPATRLKGRFEVKDLIGERQEVARYRGLDHGAGAPGAAPGAAPVPVIIVTAAAADLSLPMGEEAEVEAVDDDIMPGFDDFPLAVAEEDTASAWPSPTWEKGVLEAVNNPVWPKVIDSFVEEGREFLILEKPAGTSIWDAWDDPDADADVRYGWLEQLATGLDALHQAGAMFEGLCPEVVVVDAAGQARITDVAELLPLPLPVNATIRGTLYSAPELLLNPGGADGRADLYSFGALIYALEYLHHNLEEKDFERPYVPKQITDRYPDVHPMLPRLINKTFTRELDYRFPTDEMIDSDPTGIRELIKTLQICRRTLDRVRLDVAAWTTTGMIRTGNEDTFGFLHGAEARQDDVYEYAMVLLADGMGGYEAGEVAAAMTVHEMRKFLLQQPMFAGLAGISTPPPAGPDQMKEYEKILEAALKHAHKEVYTASRSGKGKRGMGCTAEVVFIDSKNIVVGHVGDSRVYHLSNGRLKMMTRDQTLVNRLVELGRLTPEEAENHDQKNQLQQAIGGQPEVKPEMYHAPLKRGDWVLVCSDGLTGHVPDADIETMLTRECNGSAEDACRRLCNLVNLRGATDNSTLVIVRAS